MPFALSSSSFMLRQGAVVSAVISRILQTHNKVQAIAGQVCHLPVCIEQGINSHHIFVSSDLRHLLSRDEEKALLNFTLEIAE